MLGFFSILPLLKGWEWRLYQGTRVVRKGETVEILRASETGQIIGGILVTTDCYAGVIVDAQGADLRTESLEYYPEDYWLAGFTVEDPNGWVSRYLRPDPNSTVGYYVLEVAPGAHACSVPFVPTLVMKFRLRNESTQEQSQISVAMRGINITNKPLFINSLRRVLYSKADLAIDPALLSIGPADFKEDKK